MILGSRADGQRPTAARSGFHYVRGQNQTTVTAVSPVRKRPGGCPRDYGFPKRRISQISLNENGLPQAQVTKIADRVKTKARRSSPSPMARICPEGPQGAAAIPATGLW